MRKLNLRKIIIGMILFISWLIITGAYIYNKANVTVLTEEEKSVLTHSISGEFLANQKITGEFVSGQNYLGQVSIRFYNYNRINSDSVTFRIKEKGAGSWYYENRIKTDQFLPDELFPFGFPPIVDSKGKTYDFEVQSVKGVREDAITLSTKNPLVTTTYQFPKKSLIKPSIFSKFLIARIQYTKLDRDFLIALISYSDFIMIFVFLEFLLLKNLTVKSLNLKKISSSWIIAVGLIVLILSAILYALKKSELSQAVTTLSYFLLVLGVFVKLFEFKKTKI